MQLFEYAIILEEKREKGKVVSKAEVLSRGDLLAEDLEQVNILVARLIPEDKITELERITLAVRPF